MAFASATQPESYSELLARSFSLYCRGFRRAYLFGLLIAVLVFIPRLLCVAMGQNVFLTSPRWNKYQLLFIAIYIGTLWFLAALLWCLHCIARNKHENFISDFEMAGKRIIYVLGAAILLFFIGILASIPAYILHQVFWWFNFYSHEKYLTDFLIFLVLLTQVGLSLCITVLFYFYFPLIVTENDGIFLALKQSMRLVWKNIRRTFYFQLTPWLVYLVTLIVVKMIFKVNIHIYFMPGNPVSNFYATLLHIFILSLFVPWGASAILIQLKDLELRKAAALKKK